MMMHQPFLWDALQEAKKPIVLYGMGNGADKILDAMQERGIAAFGVFASDGFVRGHSFRGFPVLSYDAAKERFGDMVVLLAFGTHRPEVLQNIERISEEQELYVPDIEIASGLPFTEETFTALKEDLACAQDLLGDEESREVFRAIVSWKVSGDPRFLLNAPHAGLEEGLQLLGLGNEERVLDAGAYTGDTLAAYDAAIGGWESYVALEPDAHSFSCLAKNAARFSRVTSVRAVLGQEDGTAHFASLGGRQSHVTEKGGASVPQIAADSIRPVPTFLKMDIEGREMDALRGAAALIRYGRPKMAISAYHRHSDLSAIPQFVHALWARTKIFLRMPRALPNWDTMYYFR